MELETRIVEGSDHNGDDIDVRLNEEEGILTVELHNKQKGASFIKLYIGKDDMPKLIEHLEYIYSKI